MIRQDYRAAQARAWDAEQLARLRTRLVERGFTLHARPEGGWVIVRWGLSHAVDDLDSLAEFVARVNGREVQR